MVNLVREASHDLSTLNEAVDVLVQLGGRAVPKLLPLLSHPKSEVRIAGCLLLGHSGVLTAVQPLIEKLSDPDPNVVYHAIEGLGRLGAYQAQPELANISTSDDFFLAFAALEALGLIGAASVLPEVLSLTRDELMKEQALLCLRDIGHPAVLPTMLELLQDRDVALPALISGCEAAVQWADKRKLDLDLVRSRVATTVTPEARARILEEGLNAEAGVGADYWKGLVRLLGWTADSPADDLLLSLLENLQAADFAVAIFPTDRLSQEFIRRGLSHWDMSVRLRVARLLARWDAALAVDELLNLIDTTGSQELARVAASSVATHGDSVALKDIILKLAHSDEKVRRSILPLLDGRPLDHLEDLEALLDSTFAEVRSAAAWWQAESKLASGFPVLWKHFLEEEVSAVQADLLEAVSSCQDYSLELAGWVLDHWNSISVELRSSAARILDRLPLEKAIPLLRLALQDSNFWVRLYACRSASSRRELVEAVSWQELRRDALPPIRAAAATLLGQRQDDDTEQMLSEMLSDSESDVVRAAISALGLRKTAAAEEVLQNFYCQTQDSGYQRAVLNGLIGSDSARSVKLAGKAISHPGLRLSAWNLLWASGHSEAGKELVRCVLDETTHALLIDLDKPETTVTRIAEELERSWSGSFAHKLRWIKAALQFQPQGVMEMLRKALSQEPDPWVRRALISGLWFLCMQQSLEFSQTLPASEADPKVRELIDLFTGF